ncbi:MAG: hypothetical protein PHX68_03470 [Alphaproteobacteria bacterium]|nr:hypothetical protein [Alphaproteobacteria bacterium]
MDQTQHTSDMQQRIAALKTEMTGIVAPLKQITRVDKNKDIVVRTDAFAPYQRLFADMTAVDQSLFLNALGDANPHAEMLVIGRFLDAETIQSVRFPKALGYHLRKHFPEEGVLHYIGMSPDDKLPYVFPNARMYTQVQKALSAEHARRYRPAQNRAAAQVRHRDAQQQM